MNPYPLSTELLSYLHDPSMSESECINFNKTLLRRMNTTIADFEERLKGCLEEGSTIKGLADKIKLESILKDS